MLPDSEDQPFLGYSDKDLPHNRSHQHQHGQRRLKISRSQCALPSLPISHILVCLVTSIAWILVGVFLTPQQPACHQESTTSQAAPSTHHTPGMNHHGSASAHHQTGPSKTGGTGFKLGLELNHNITSHARRVHCGGSTVEAKQRGCKYDILLNDWVPSECWDPSTIAEYQDDDSWRAYRDENLTDIVSTVDEMSEMEFYYTSTRDHINHCSMLWRKQFNSFYYENATFDTVIADPMHTEHCTQYLIDMGHRIKEWATEPVRTEPGWSGCWIRDGPHDW